MSIPNQRAPSPPPPLPPPRFLHDIAVGLDPGYHYSNSQSKGEFEARIGCGSPDSRLRQSWDLVKDEALDFDQSDERESRRSPSIQDFHAMGHIDEGYHSLSGSSLAQRLAYSGSGGSLLGQRLKGERHLERQNRKDSSHAYDKHLLDRIGTHKTPPRSSTLGSIEMSPVSQTSQSSFPRSGKPPPPLKSTSFSDGSFSATSDSPFKVGSPFGSKWRDSPQSAVVSPSLISNGVSAKSFSDYRNPTYDSIHTPSSATDSERFPHMRQASRRSDSSGSIMVGGFDEGGASVLSKSKRGESYDRLLTNDPDLDSDFPTEETRRMRRLHLDDRTPPNIDVQSPNSRLGTKRKASSPHRDSPRDDKAPLQVAGGTSSELYQRRTSGHHLASRASPVNRYHHTHGSVSPASSGGLRNSSYASSAGLSVGGASSITSISSYGRLSPGAISPVSEEHEGRDSHYLLSASSESSLQNLAALSHQHITSENKSSAALAQKMSTDNANRVKQATAPKLQANIHMCSCCPKKPKKFDTLEELRHHQNEKQYHCNFCHNRFKNKNEAERHQNSLHLRRNSWSCATLDRNYQAAFHPCNAIPPNTNVNHAPPQQPGVPAPTDVCGYCGQNFPNFPAPDWTERSNHLVTVHKFGECNQSKKFFRADHFRQHLKHSHAGTSGKWTNMLENSCMKEEPPTTPEAQSQEHLRQQAQQEKQLEQQLQGAPVANMMGGGPGMRQGGYGVVGMGMPVAGELQHTRIDEDMHEEM
ncbi:hypothetical protein MMC30_001537 [Trapelia coarctata]|nr:hypothetical protein [Trapelia coarctata]